MISKWGFDGSGGQARYKQAFRDGTDSDAQMFLTCLVPLQLICSDTKKLIWENPRPNSTRSYRPIRFQFKKETPETIIMEKKYIEDQVFNLQMTSIANVTIKHELILSMVDGKVCNSLTNTTATQKCFICGVLPTNMNDIESVIQRSVKEEALSFGISPLHARIRFYECLLHIAYRLDLKKWQVRGDENKTLVASRKRSIQDKFRSQLGLLVDFPQQGGGNTNDGILI